eukprot:NODE_135_length_16508_cov_1.365897.p6 type:complete len:333 gc:universal NODE_135_length_16508_cov_1.365897:5712-4714(-)
MVQVVKEKHDNSQLVDNVQQKPKAQDLWAAILFWMNTIAFLALSIWAYSTAKWEWIIHPDSGNTKSGSSEDNPFSAAGIASLFVGFAFAIGMTIVYLSCMQRFPEALVKFSFWFYFVILAISTIILFTFNIVMAIINVIVLVIIVFMWFGIRSQIPFLAALLSTVVKVTRKYPATIYTVFAGDILSLIWSGFSAGAFMSYYIKFALSKDSNGQLIYNGKNPSFVFCVIYGMFSSYWAMNVIRYLVHVAVCGVYATYYFLADNMPSSPTFSSLKRAMTTSFGSVCFGALLITIVQMIRQLLNYARQRSDTPVAFVILCCLECIVRCFEGLLEL